MRYITPAQRERKNQKKRDKRKRDRKANSLVQGKELKRPETSGVCESDSAWCKQLCNLSSVVGKACLEFFKRRGIPYEYHRPELS